MRMISPRPETRCCPPLLMTQCLHGVQSRRAPGGERSGQTADADQADRGDDAEREGKGRLAEELQGLTLGRDPPEDLDDRPGRGKAEVAPETGQEERTADGAQRH